MCEEGFSSNSRRFEENFCSNSHIELYLYIVRMYTIVYRMMMTVNNDDLNLSLKELV